MYVSYGLSELYTPGPNDDPAWWGWGFELSFWIATAGEEEPPEWPFIILNAMAKHVRTNKVLLEPGDRVDFGRPISGYPDVPEAPSSDLRVLAVTVDLLLGEMATPNGKAVFLELVGVTLAEKEQMVRTSTASVLDRLAEENPLLVTDPSRSPT